MLFCNNFCSWFRIRFMDPALSWMKVFVTKYSNCINNNIDILMISETKLDPSFPTGQFHIHGFSEPYRFDRNSSGGGILLYIREDIPSKLILTKLTIEGFFSEINLRKKGGFFDIRTFERNWQKS